jgi:hypothetical protein
MRPGTIGSRLVSALISLLLGGISNPITAVAGASATVASDALMNPFDGEYEFTFLY